MDKHLQAESAFAAGSAALLLSGGLSDGNYAPMWVVATICVAGLALLAWAGPRLNERIDENGQVDFGQEETTRSGNYPS